jgi:hypothetical protein
MSKLTWTVIFVPFNRFLYLKLYVLIVILGEVISFENLVSSIFEFVHALVETPRFRSAVRDGISQIIYYIILFMQITEEQVSTWTGNPDRFVEDESEDSFSYSVRLAAQDLLLVKKKFNKF